MDSLEAPGRYQGGRTRPFWTACEAAERHMDTGKAPGKQERAIWTACKAPEKYQGGKDHLDSLGGTREAGKD